MRSRAPPPHPPTSLKTQKTKKKIDRVRPFFVARYSLQLGLHIPLRVFKRSHRDLPCRTRSIYGLLTFARLISADAILHNLQDCLVMNNLVQSEALHRFSRLEELDGKLITKTNRLVAINDNYW